MDDLDSGRGVTPRLPSLSSRQLITALRKAGFEDAPRRGKGSHVALVKQGSPPRLVIVPFRKSLPSGTVRGIIRQAGLEREEFLDLLG